MKGPFSIIAAALILMVVSPQGSANQPVVLTAEEAARMVLVKPMPAYPHQAKVLRRMLRIKGRGLFTLHVRTKTGEVMGVEVRQSTGLDILDAAATKALLRWRFRPNGFEFVTIPIHFLD